jgi:hypothetical protein
LAKSELTDARDEFKAVLDKEHAFDYLIGDPTD